MTEKEAIDWVAGMFNESPGDISPETLREDIPEWDSIGVLTLMAEMDEKFDIVLSDEQTNGMTTVSDILELLREKGNLDS